MLARCVFRHPVCSASEPVPVCVSLSLRSNSVDKKNAKVALDAYVGVLQSVFDHQAPVRKEAEFFLQHMDDWTGRDPLAELPKANFAARVSEQRGEGCSDYSRSARRAE